MSKFSARCFLFCLGALALAPVRAEWIGRADGTVFDTDTGLIWMRCAVGQSWTGTTCSGAATHHTWAQAVALSSNHAGYTDWRLPNIRELQSIINYWNASPAVDSGAFPATPSMPFWSSTTSQWSTDAAWYISFDSGETEFGTKAVTYDPGFGIVWAARLVRGGLSSALLNAARPDADYTDLGSGMVKHVPTGLIWQRCPVGQTWTGSQCSGTAQTFSHDQALALTDSLAGHTDWRLPEPAELLSLGDYQLVPSSSVPAINNTWFPGVQIVSGVRSFWTSMRYKSPFTAQSWTVNFNSASSGGGSNDVTDSVQVRLVRKETVTYSSLTVSKSGNGSGILNSSPWAIDCGTACTGDFPVGTWVMLIPVAQSGSHFSGWSGSCSGSGTCIVEIATTSRSVNATFSLNGPPAAPVITSARIGAGLITLDFTAPANDGGSAIINYTATCSAPGYATKTQTGASSPITIRRLAGGAHYTCSLRATNDYGVGEATVWPSTLTPRRPGIAGTLMILMN